MSFFKAVGNLVKGAAKVVDVALDIATAPVSVVTSILPGKVGDIVKGGLGILTGNPTLVASAAVGLFSSSGDKKSGPKTELSPRTATNVSCPPSSSAGPQAGGVRYDPRSHLDSNYPKYVDALNTLNQNWSTFDSVVGAADRRITRENLTHIRNNPYASQELKQAANFLLQHPEYFNRLEVSGNLPLGPFMKPDGTIQRHNLKAELAKAQADMTRWGVRPLPPGHWASALGPVVKSLTTGSVGGCANGTRPESLQSFVANGRGSVEERALSVMGDMMTKLDGEFESLVAQMERGEGDSATLQLKLQQVMEKRSRMHNLMSTISSKLNEMWNHSIQNMGRA